MYNAKKRTEKGGIMTNSYFEGLKERKLRRCQYYKPLPDSVSYCKLDEVACKVEQGDYDCQEWWEIQAEWLKEEHYEKAKPFPSYKVIRDKLNGG